jgi:hypothetical protein
MQTGVAAPIKPSSVGELTQVGSDCSPGALQGANVTSPSERHHTSRAVIS